MNTGLNPAQSAEGAEGRRRGTTWALLLSVTAAALALRLWGLGAESLWEDELAQVSLYHLPLSYLVIAATELPQPPLDCLIGAGLHRLSLAESDWWVRLPAALFGAGGVFLLGWWVKRLAGGPAGVAAALLLAVCPLHLAMSQEARPYTLFFFFALAGVLAFARARRRHTLLSWCFFSVIFLGLLMTRWIEPYVITFGLAAYALGAWLRSVWRDDAPGRRAETLKLWAAFTAMLAAYAINNPWFGLMFESHRRAIHASGATGWSTHLAKHLSDAYAAIISGYCGPSLSAVPVSRWVLVLAAALALAGLVGLLGLIRRRRNPLAVLFVVTMVPFPILFAATWAWFTGPNGKPQYMFLMAAPLFGCVAVAADALRRATRPAGRAPSWLLFAAAVGAIALPMAHASVRGLGSPDKRDWRGVMTYLRNHADPGDAFAAVAADAVPPAYLVRVHGHGRYGLRDTEFLLVDLDTDVKALEAGPWSRSGNTVWLVGYNYRDCPFPMYLGYDQIPTPTNPPANMTLHTFHGLFIVEISGEGLAAERLMAGFDLLYRGLPEASSLVAPAILRGRYLRARGDLAGARSQFDIARRQCRNERDVRILTEQHLPGPQRSASVFPEFDSADPPALR